jgi:adenylate cyclase
MTVDLVNDWAFVCPLGGDANKGWAIYVAGVSRDPNPGFGDSDVNDLQGDVKFTELVGATLANLRRVQNLEERQSTFRPFFSPVVLEAFVDQEPEDVLRPRKCEISVLFCDLRGFSAKSEQMADQLEELLDRVSQALGIMTKTVLDYGGVIGDFHGDSAMGFWGWPLERQDTFESVCRAALAIQAELAAIAEQPEHRLHDFQMGIGVATGTAVAGKIGTSHQVKVTAFGPVVNLAARLEGMTRQLNIPILVDRRTAEQAGKYWQNSDVPPAGLRFLGRFRPFGLNVATDIYQLYAPMEALDPQVKVTYQNGWDQFRSSNWHESLAALQSIEKTDPAARFLSKYIRAHSLQKGFDGVIELRAK